MSYGIHTPPWLKVAENFIGQREVPGPGSSAWLRSMWLSLRGGAWFWQNAGGDDSKLPWCGAFAAYCVQQARLAHPQRYASARAWLDWGEELVAPAPGAAVVFERGPKFGHVGFVHSVAVDGRLLVLGGNQGDGVSVAPFDRARVLGYRAPVGWAAKLRWLRLLQVPVAGASSTNEA